MTKITGGSLGESDKKNKYLNIEEKYSEVCAALCDVCICKLIPLLAD